MDLKYGEGKQPSLPPGISGIARLDTCEIRLIIKENKDVYLFYASGIVIEGVDYTYEDQEGAVKRSPVDIRGLKTVITEPLYDTPDKTLSEHIRCMVNELRKLGCNLVDDNCLDLRKAFALLQESKPLFKFRTWAYTVDGKVFVAHRWDGMVADDCDTPFIRETRPK